MKKSIMVFLSVILLVGVLAACGTTKKDNAAGDSSKKKVLTMGTSADYPPFESVDTTGSKNIVGFDVDLAKAIAGKLGYQVQVKDMDFSGLIQAIKSGQVDFVLAGMTPTADRKKNVDFSDIYYQAQNMIVSKKSSGINKVEDLKGKTVGVQLGSIQEGKAKDINKTVQMNVVNRDRIPDLIEELKAGRMDAAIIEDTVAKGFLTKETELKGFTIKDDPEAGSAIAFPKNSDLTAKFNKELETMKKNGELKKLILKWFGADAKQQ